LISVIWVVLVLYALDPLDTWNKANADVVKVYHGTKLIFPALIERNVMERALTEYIREQRADSTWQPRFGEGTPESEAALIAGEHDPNHRWWEMGTIAIRAFGPPVLLMAFGMALQWVGRGFM
jgi:hypothetical protein